MKLRSLLEGRYTGAEDEFVTVAAALHDSNRFQWDREKEIRRPGLEAAAVLQIKRAIDESNHRRMRLVERLDAICGQRMAIDDAGTSDGYVNSETIGQLVDRLSILTLKVAFARARAAAWLRREAQIHAHYESEVREIERQWEYIAVCYDRFVNHLRAGSGSMLVSRQFKFYDSEV